MAMVSKIIIGMNTDLKVMKLSNINAIGKKSLMAMKTNGLKMNISNVLG